MGSCLRVPTLPLWLGRATVSNSLASGRYCRLAPGGQRGRWSKALVRHGADAWGAGVVAEDIRADDPPTLPPLEPSANPPAWLLAPSYGSCTRERAGVQSGFRYGLLSWTPKMRQVAKVEPCP